MTITLFGIFWIIISIIFLFKKIEHNFFLLLWSCVFQANAVLIIGENDISSLFVSSIFFIIKNLFTLRSIRKLEKKSLVPLFFFLIVVIISMIATKLSVGVTILEGVNDYFYSQYDGSTGLYRFLVLFLLSVDLFFVINQKNRIFRPKSFMKNAIYLTWFVLIIGFIQYLFNLFEATPPDIFMNLLYSNNLIDNYFTGNPSFVRICSTFQEASYCSLFLVGMLWFLYYSIPKKTKSIIFLLILIIIEIILTFSTTAYASLLFGVCIEFIHNKRMSKRITIIALCSAVVLLVMLFGLPENIYMATLGKSNSLSTNTRNEWNNAAWLTFIESNYFGVGFRNIRASSMILNILGQLGIIGFIVFIYFIASIIKPILHRENNIGYISLLLCVLLGCVLSCPDIDNCVLWLSFFMSIGARVFLNKRSYKMVM